MVSTRFTSFCTSRRNPSSEEAGLTSYSYFVQAREVDVRRRASIQKLGRKRVPSSALASEKDHSTRLSLPPTSTSKSHYSPPRSVFHFYVPTVCNAGARGGPNSNLTDFSSTSASNASHGDRNDQPPRELDR